MAESETNLEVTDGVMWLVQAVPAAIALYLPANGVCGVPSVLVAMSSGLRFIIYILWLHWNHQLLCSDIVVLELAKTLYDAQLKTSGNLLVLGGPQYVQLQKLLQVP